MSDNTQRCRQRRVPRSYSVLPLSVHTEHCLQLVHRPSFWVQPSICPVNRAAGPCFDAFGKLRLKCVGTRSETRFRAKRTSPFKSAGWPSVRWTTGSLGVRISGSNAGYTMFRGTTHCIGQFPLHFPSHASPCAITFQLDSTMPSDWTFLVI